MKKFVFLCLLFLTSVTLHSQLFKGGILAGFNASQIDGDRFGGYHKAGMLVGAYVALPLKDQLFLRTELKFTEKGSHKKTDPENDDYELYKARLGYIEMPFLLNWKYFENVSFDIGPSIGYLMYAKEENEYGEFPPEDVKDFNSFEFGGNANVNYHFDPHFILQLAFFYSIIPVREHAGGGTYYLNRGQYNNMISFSLRYEF